MCLSVGFSGGVICLTTAVHLINEDVKLIKRESIVPELL